MKKIAEMASARPPPLQPDPRTIFPIPYWYEWNFWEPCVQLALRDICRPGDVVFDVGANAGGLTVPMSRLVGPRGVVCAFEASPRIVDKCQHNLAVNGCGNVQLFHRAVFRRSYEIVRIYFGSDLNDTLFPEMSAGGEYSEVETIAIDDFVEHIGLSPNLVKMDIEGAEFDALQGMEQTIKSARPHLILEQQPSDMRCHEFLQQFGYYAVDLATFKLIASAADYGPSTEVANVLFVHESREGETPYRPPFTLELQSDLPATVFVSDDSGSRNLRSPLPLDAGRYLFEADFSADGCDNEMMAGIEVDGSTIFRYHTNTRFLSSSYRYWVIHLERNQSVNVFFRFQNGTSDPTFDFQGVKIFRVTDFNSICVPLVD